MDKKDAENKQCGKAHTPHKFPLNLSLRSLEQEAQDPLHDLVEAEARPESEVRSKEVERVQKVELIN